MTDYAAVQDYLFSLKARGLKFGIDRMRGFAAELGHPEAAVPAIHVAGTNGKGSVSAMLEAILRASGRRTGLYTSPHLVRLGERVQVDRRLLTPEEILAYTAELRPVAERVSLASPEDHPSFFEFMTAMAFLQFARRKCEVAVIEVGMGGRLDATNIVNPEVAVITSIGLDHCEFLGDTLAQIAGEKAGIIKPGRPVVIGRLPAEAEAVIRVIATECGAKVFSVRERFRDDLTRCPQTSLVGDYQRWNAATALLVSETLPEHLRPDGAVALRALRQVDWAGRWQQLAVGGRQVVLDASHNAEGAGVLDASLTRLRTQTGQAPVIVTGILGQARAQALLPVLARHAREIHLVLPQQERACSQATLAEILHPIFTGEVRPGSVAGIFPGPGRCTLGEPGDAIVVTGSIYLIGEVLARLEPDRGSGEGRLQDF
jgi:dihydrofolate synthase/folylpolyglutamate synthase